jgi:hypothetical protein
VHASQQHAVADAVNEGAYWVTSGAMFTAKYRNISRDDIIQAHHVLKPAMSSRDNALILGPGTKNIPFIACTVVEFACASKATLLQKLHCSCAVVWSQMVPSKFMTIQV